MKNQVFFLVILLSPFMAFAQSKTETRSLSNFKSISISSGFDKVVLVQGNKESVEIEASGIDLSNIVTEVSKNGLVLDIKKGMYKNNKVTLTVTFREINELNNSGSTDIETQNTITCEKFSFNSSGSGDFNGEFEVDALNIALSGSSDIELAGRAENQKYAINGSGDIKASSLKGETASVAISGSGDVSLNVSGRVKTAVSGSGRVNNSN